MGRTDKTMNTWLRNPGGAGEGGGGFLVAAPEAAPTAKRVIACLDVRANDNGDLVVTKGDQYDVREKDDERGVRNLGKPVELAARYFKEGADEVAFLNITGFRDFPLGDMPMLAVLQVGSPRTVRVCELGKTSQQRDRWRSPYLMRMESRLVGEMNLWFI